MHLPIKLLPLLMLCSVACARVPARTDVETAANRKVSGEMSNLKVSAFAEDTLGHIWIGTFRGLNKYNSYEFTQFFCSDDEEDLPDNQINAVFRDSKGRLWVATVDGVAVYTDRDCFRRIPMEHWYKDVFQIFEDKDGVVYINNVLSLMAYDEENDCFTEVIGNLDPQTTMVEKGYVDGEGNLWMANPRCLRRYGRTSSTPTDSILLSGYPTVSHMQDERYLWLAGNGPVQIYDLLSRKFVETPACVASNPAISGSVRLIHPYAGGLLFYTGDDGLYYYDAARGAVYHEGGEGFPFDPPEFGITAMFTDSNGNLWIGSEDRGYTVRYSSGRKFNNDRTLCPAFADKSVTGLCVDLEGRLWISTLMNGLWIYSPGEGAPRQVPLPVPDWGGQNKHKTGYVFADRDGYIWITDGDNTVLQCRYSGGRLVLDKAHFVFGVRYVTQDEDGTVWLTCNSWFVYSKREGEREFTQHEVFSPGFIFVPCIVPLGDGTLLTTGFGRPFMRINSGDGSAVELAVEEEDYRTCIHRSALIPVVLFRDSRSDVWIGTIANGLMKYSFDDGRLVPVPEVPCSDISSIAEDHAGNIWVSTLNGLYECNMESGLVTGWYAYDGVGGNQFHERSSCVMPDGTLVFGGTHGLTVFKPEEVKERRNVSVVFEDLKVYNRHVIPGRDGIIDRSLSLRPDISLKHSQNGFSISFSALYYSEFSRIHYSYCLEGFDNYWIDAGDSHEAYYSNLPRGRYTFRVRATDNGKSILGAENSVRIRVKPTPWGTWWAYCIYFLLLSSITVYICSIVHRMRKERETARRERMEKEQEQRVNKMNMSFFANVSHEFRTPLSMISGPVAQLSADPSITGANRNLLKIVGRSVDRMLRLVNQLLDFNRLDNDALKLNVRRTDLIEELKMELEPYRESCAEKGIDFASYGVEDTFLMYLDADKLDKIMANLLSNAMKFTPPGGSVEVFFDIVTGREASGEFSIEPAFMDSQYVRISVVDSGPGIPEDKLEKIFERYYQLDGGSAGKYNYGSGIGLYYSRALAGLHHGQLKAAHRADGACGAAFILLLPAWDGAYSAEEIDAGVESQAKAYPLGGRDVASAGESAVASAPAESDGADSEKPTVLVVDDDADVVHYLLALLSDRYRVICRFNAQSALEIMEKDVPDVIVCDVAMPGMSGHELCREIKGNLQLCHIPVILLTAKVSTEDVVEGLDSGAEAYITKPFNPAVLLSAINSQLRNREMVSRLLTSATTVDELEDNALSPQDNAFMKDLYKLMEEEITNSELNVVGMAEQLHISRTKIYYKVKGLTGESPSNFFKTYKLNRAAELIREGRNTMSEIADLTGFSSLSYFSICFKKQFGVPPSEYRS